MKPLILCVRLIGYMMKVEYEGLYITCFNYGKYEYRMELCPRGSQGSYMGTQVNKEQMAIDGAGEDWQNVSPYSIASNSIVGFGPRMLPKQRTRGRPNWQTRDSTGTSGPGQPPLLERQQHLEPGAKGTKPARTTPNVAGSGQRPCKTRGMTSGTRASASSS